MSLYGSGVECALHCLLHLVGAPAECPPSSRDLAEFQGVSPSFVAKLFTRLEKAGIVASGEGIQGGFVLARPAREISVLDVVDAVEGEKPLFRCREIRRNCVLYDAAPPRRATHGVCEIHAVMLEAEERMRASLARRTLGDIARTVGRKLPDRQVSQTHDWFEARGAARRRGARGPRRNGRNP